MRRKRIDMTLQYFQEFRGVCRNISDTNPAALLPPFNPPSPVLMDGIQSLFEMKEIFLEDNFRSCVNKIFQSVGLALR